MAAAPGFWTLAGVTNGSSDDLDHRIAQFGQFVRQNSLGLIISVNQADCFRRFLHPGDEVDQIRLVCVRGVPVDSMHLGCDVVVASLESNSMTAP